MTPIVVGFRSTKYLTAHYILSCLEIYLIKLLSHYLTHMAAGWCKGMAARNIYRWVRADERAVASKYRQEAA